MANCCNDTSSCNGLTYSSNCILWASDNISSYSIEKGDNLTSIVVTITDTLDDLSSGKIDLSDITITCQAISDLVGTDKSLKNILSNLISYQCTLKDYVDSKTNTVPVSYDLKCLTSTGSKESDIIQALINQSCANKSSISSLNSTVSNNSDDISSLQADVAAIKGDASSSTPVFTPSQLMPPYMPQAYIGPLSNFDSNGVGIASKGYDKVYIMNGQNGTQDWRGYSPIGATAGIPGGSLDPRVNSSNNNGFSLNPGEKTGEIYHTLTITEIPSHTHVVNDPGHSHTYTEVINASHPKGGSTNAPRHYSSSQTSKSKTGITINSSGGGQSHNNVQPSVGTVWIVKIP